MNKNSQNHHPVDHMIKNTLSGEAPEVLHEQADQYFESTRRQLSQNVFTPKTKVGLNFLPFRFRWAAVGTLALIGIIILSGVFVPNSNMSWAEVQKRFQSASYFSASVYITENPLESPDKFELWVRRGGKCRFHHEGKVYFAQNGELTQAIDVTSAQSFQPEKRSKINMILSMLSKFDQFSLETFLKTLCGEKTLSPPLVNDELSLSDDLTVFDITNNRTPEWIRVWVLKTSGLPVRIRVWDPRQAESVDVFLDYIKEQPDEAFDPDAFQKALITQSHSNRNRLYTLLKDPGGRSLTPGDVFKQTGYHMPSLKEIGMNENGVVWVFATNGVNRTSNGRYFYGFGKLTDDLGQEYLFVPQGHQVKDDLTLGYYIPYEYKIDFQKPTMLYLTCTTQPDHHQQEYTEIGTLEIEEWDEGKPLPALLNNRQSFDPLKTLINEAMYRHDWDHFDRLIEMLKDDEENAFYRDWMMLKKHMSMQAYEKAYSLAKKLYLEIKDQWEFSNYGQRDLITIYIKLLVRHGDQEKAQDLIKQVKARFEDTQSYLEVIFITDLATFFRYNLRMPVDDIAEMLRVDLNDEKYTPYLGSGIRGKSISEDPAFEAWREYAQAVFDHYENQTLPETIAQVEIKKTFDPTKSNYPYRTPLPFNENYYLVQLNGKLNRLLMNYAVADGHDHRLIKVDEGVKDKLFNASLIVHKSVERDEMYDWFFEQNGLQVVSKEVNHPVWVARYDGRELPHLHAVRPADGSHLGRRPVVRAGGTHTTITSLLDAFSNAINGWENSFNEDTVLIIDETGLPTRPGENQTWGSICIAYHYSFWDGPEGIELGKTWFEENFGITFSEETRKVEILEIKKVEE